MRLLLALFLSCIGAQAACSAVGGVANTYYCKSSESQVDIRDWINSPANYACGSTILVDAGATYATPNEIEGGWTLKRQSGCAVGQYTTITTTSGGLDAARQVTWADFTAGMMAKVTTPNAYPPIWIGDKANNWRLVGLAVTASNANATGGVGGIGIPAPALLSNGPGFLINGPLGLSYAPRDIWIDRCLFFPIEEELYGTVTFANTDGRAWNRTSYQGVVLNGYGLKLTNSLITGFTGYIKLVDADNSGTAGKTVTAATNATNAVITATGISAAIGVTPTTSGSPSCASADQGSGRCINVLIQGATGNWAAINGSPWAEYVSADTVRLWKMSPIYSSSIMSALDSTAFGALSGTPVVFHASCCPPFYAIQTDWGDWTITNNKINSAGMIILVSGNDTPAIDPATIVSSTGCAVLGTCVVTLDHVRNLKLGDVVNVDVPGSVQSVYQSNPPYGSAIGVDPTHRAGFVTAINGNAVTLYALGAQGIDKAPTNGGIARWNGAINDSMEIRRNALYATTNTPTSGKGFSEFKAGVNVLYDGNTLGPGYFGPPFVTTHNQGGTSPWMRGQNIRFSNNLLGGPDGSPARVTLSGTDNLNTSARGSNMAFENNVMPGIAWNGVPQGSNTMNLYGFDGGGFLHNTMYVNGTPSNLSFGAAGSCASVPAPYLYIGSDVQIANNIFSASGGFSTLPNPNPPYPDCWPQVNTGMVYNVVIDYLSLGTLAALFPGTGNTIQPAAASFFTGSCLYASWDTGCIVTGALKGTASDGKDPGADILQVKDRTNGWSDDAGLLVFQTTGGTPGAVNNPANWRIGSTRAALTFRLTPGTNLASGCQVIIYNDAARVTENADTDTNGEKACNRTGSYFDRGQVTFVLGNTALTPNTTYAWKVIDGSKVMVGSFRTLAAAAAGQNVSVQLADSFADTLQVEYSANADFSGSSTASGSFASGRASVPFPVPQGAVRYYRWKKLLSAVVLATGSPTVAVAP